MAVARVTARLRRIDERAQRRCLRVTQENCCLGQAAVLLPCEAHRRLGGLQVQERGLVHDDVAAMAESTHHPLRVVRVGPRDVNQVGPCGREGFFVVRDTSRRPRRPSINAAAAPSRPWLRDATEMRWIAETVRAAGRTRRRTMLE